MSHPSSCGPSRPPPPPPPGPFCRRDSGGAGRGGAAQEGGRGGTGGGAGGEQRRKRGRRRDLREEAYRRGWETGEEGYREENRLASPVREFWDAVARIVLYLVSAIPGEAAAQISEK